MPNKSTIQNKLLYPEILKKRPNNIHKKQCGKILIIAGSKGMTGAAVLACRAAIRAGAGIVTLAYPASLVEIYKELLPEVMTLPYHKTRKGTLRHKALNLILEKSEEFDIVLIGPGLSKNKDTQKLVQDLVLKLPKPILLDADGLNALESKTELFLKRNNYKIITPHEGEMAKLTGLSVKEIQKDRIDIASKYAKEWKAVVVLKGYETIIAKPSGKTTINKTGGPSLATAGTGDVLAGIIASLLAENIKKPFEAACTGVYLHGIAGDLAEKKLGERSVIASDVIEYLSEAIKSSMSK